MEQRGNKTMMCSILFLDIEAYSRMSAPVQTAQKERFNAMLANAIRNVPINDRIILDTGNGAVITFLGDIEDSLKAALSFRESLSGQGANMDSPLQVCMGMNLGPVRLVKDINGQPNIVGDGINVAQHIMGFAKPVQILISRSYFDAASHLPQEYAGLFYSVGSHTDKHSREHEVYAVGRLGEATVVRRQTEEDTPGTTATQSSGQIAEEGLQGTLATFQNASGQQRALYAGIIASALALLAVVAVKIIHRSDTPAPQEAIKVQTTPVAAASGTAAVPAATKKAAVNPDVKSPAPETVAASPRMAESNAAKKPKAARPADVPADSPQLSSSRTPQETAVKETTKVKPGAMATVNIAVAPWGEVYLDGKKQGVSPPLDVLHVTPGAHEIEIRNTTLQPYTLSIHVKANEQIKIKHKFAN